MASLVRRTRAFAVTLTVPGTGLRTLLALTPGQAKPVAGITANEPSRWRRQGWEPTW